MLVYDTLEQARMRLENSVITVGERAFLIDGCSQRGGLGKIKLQGRFYPIVQDDPNGIHRAEDATFDIDNPDLNFRKFPLGYVNVGPSEYYGTMVGKAVFVERDTTRQQIQGLTKRGLIDPNIVNNGLGRGGLDDHTFYGQHFEDMLFGRYPTIEEALRRIEVDGWLSCAIGRNFAVGRHEDIKPLRTILYRNRVIGIAVGKKFKHFLVDSRDAYLGEVLQEAGLPFEIESDLNV